MTEIKYEIIKKIGVLSTSAPALSVSKGQGGPRSSTWSVGMKGSRNMTCAIGQRIMRRWATPPDYGGASPPKVMAGVRGQVVRVEEIIE